MAGHGYIPDPQPQATSTLLVEEALCEAAESIPHIYDSTGNLTQLVDAANGDTQSFAYDFRDRLTLASGTSPGYSESYTYNAIGNLTSKGGVSYTYGDTAHPHAVTGRSNGDSYGYDANGNMISRTEGGQGYSQSFDAENRLVGVSGAGSASFVYDGDGTLVKQTVGTVTTKHYFPTWEVQNGTLIKYYQLGGKRVAVRQGCDLSYLHTDHLGSTSLVTASDGSEQGRQRYLPFGGMRASSGSLPTDKLYTGQEYVAGIGLYNYGARFYAAGLARFVSADTVGVEDTNPQTLNRYSYVLNNPLRYTDPSGHWTCPDEDSGDLSQQCQRAKEIREERARAEQERRQAIIRAAEDDCNAIPGHINCSFEYEAAVDHLSGGGVLFDWLDTQESFEHGTTLDKAFAIALLIGNGGRNMVVKITVKSLTHVVENHSANQLAKWVGRKSYFYAEENISALIRESDAWVERASTYGKELRYERIVDAGRIIGWDVKTGLPTTVYTVVRNAAGELVTAHPGLPY